MCAGLKPCVYARVESEWLKRRMEKDKTEQNGTGLFCTLLFCSVSYRVFIVRFM